MRLQIALLLTSSLTAVLCQDSCAGTDSYSIWQNRCAQYGRTANENAWNAGLNACSAQYYPVGSDTTRNAIYKTATDAADAACVACYAAQPPDSDTVCRPACDRATEVRNELAREADRLYCSYIQCAQGIPCVADEKCAHIENVCQTLGGIAQDPTVQAGEAVANLCGWGGSAAAVASSASAAAGAGVLGVGVAVALGSCAATGGAIAGIGTAATYACQACNLYAESNGCGKSICKQAITKRDNVTLIDKRYLTTGQCGSDGTLDVSGVTGIPAQGCGLASAAFNQLDLWGSANQLNVRQDIGSEVTDFFGSPSCAAYLLIEDTMSAVNALPVKAFPYQQTPCNLYETISANQSSSTSSSASSAGSSAGTSSCKSFP